MHRGVGGEQRHVQRPQHHQQQPEHGAGPGAPPHQGPGDGPGARRVARPEPGADEGLRRDGEGVEGQREQAPDGEGDLRAGQLDRAEPGGDPGQRQHRDAQREGAHQQRAPRPSRRPVRRAGRATAAAPRPRGGPQDDAGEGAAGHELHQRGADGRARGPQVEAVHEQHVERGVDDGGGDRDPQRGDGVLQPAQHAGRGEHEQHPGQARAAHQRRYATACGRAAVGRPEQVEQRGTADQPAERQGGPEGDGQPEPVHAAAERRAPVAGSRGPRHRGGGAVRQEDAQPDRGEQDRGGGADAGEGVGAQPADDDLVDEQEQRLGDQRPERRHGQAQRPRGPGTSPPPAPPPGTRPDREGTGQPYPGRRGRVGAGPVRRRTVAPVPRLLHVVTHPEVEVDPVPGAPGKDRCAGVAGCLPSRHGAVRSGRGRAPRDGTAAPAARPSCRSLRRRRRSPQEAPVPYDPVPAAPRPSRRERRGTPAGRARGHALPQRPAVPPRDYAARRRG